MKKVANCLGIDIITLYGKLNGKTDFWRHEIDLTLALFNLTIQEADEIFFCDELTDTQV